MVARYCADCSVLRNKDSFSKTQWSKGEGISRCRTCLGHSQNGGGSTLLDPSQTARRNDSHEATFTEYALNNPFAAGSFRWVAKGVYVSGNRAGEDCVCKWFKKGCVMESHFYETDLESSRKAIELISNWNSKGLIDKMIKVNLPEVWEFKNNSIRAGQKVLQEPFIEGYQKFNSNTGWADDSLPWPRVMQALSHFTYHISGGQCLLCDIQGGVYSDGVVLTDPVVMSTSIVYGPTDLGPKGMSTFFANHTCNEYCRAEWLKPRNRQSYYAPTAGTTMVSQRRVPTRTSRPAMTQLGYVYE